MHSLLDIGDPAENLIADPSFEKQASGTISSPWILERGTGGIDRNHTFSRGGSNNVWMRSAAGWNGIKQTVQVTPNTEYKLTGFIKTAQNNNAGYFGVRGSAGNVLKEVQYGKNDNYTKQTVRFNSRTNTSVTVFTGFWPNGDTWVQIDDYSLIAVDATPPVITIEGNSAIDVPLDGTFTDPGAIAIDNLDGDLTHKIVVEGRVNPHIVGTYTLTYKVSDAEGNAAAAVTRTVNVKGTGIHDKQYCFS